jgi:hypothetical protein
VESRRYGIAKKAADLRAQRQQRYGRAEIKEMYPGAKVLYVDNLDPREHRRHDANRIANDDWDAVVVPHSLIDRFALTEETLMEMAAEDIAALEEEAIEAAAGGRRFARRRRHGRPGGDEEGPQPDRQGTRQARNRSSRSHREDGAARLARGCGHVRGSRHRHDPRRRGARVQEAADLDEDEDAGLNTQTSTVRSRCAS